MKHQEINLQEVTDYLTLFAREQNLSDDDLKERLNRIYDECKRTGVYWQTTTELAYGARVAWRNSLNPIGQITWQSLTVRDLRHLTTAKDIFAAIIEHIKVATNRGKIRPTISIFAPQKPVEEGIRIWNSSLICYAGYRQPDGRVVGEPNQIELTEICQSMGWKGLGTSFDILPVIIKMPDLPPELFDIPKEVIMEVPITHRNYPWFADLGLKWHVLPAVSNWRLEIGGISYTAAPFNGWYMSAEISTRNFSDAYDYNMLRVVAEKMGLDTSSQLSLWKDRALVEINTALLYSFAKYGVKIVDYHMVSKQFMQHWNEAAPDRIVSADSKTIPLSPSMTEADRRPIKNVCLKPNFFPQPAAWHK